MLADYPIPEYLDLVWSQSQVAYLKKKKKKEEEEEEKKKERKSQDCRMGDGMEVSNNLENPLFVSNGVLLQSIKGSCMNSLREGVLQSYVSSSSTREGCINRVVFKMRCDGICVKGLFFGSEALSIYKIHK
jgi:hypothetical protein